MINNSLILVVDGAFPLKRRNQLLLCLAILIFLINFLPFGFYSVVQRVPLGLVQTHVDRRLLPEHSLDVSGPFLKLSVFGLRGLLRRHGLDCSFFRNVNVVLPLVTVLEHHHLRVVSKVHLYHRI